MNTAIPRSHQTEPPPPASMAVQSRAHPTSGTGALGTGFLRPKSARSLGGGHSPASAMLGGTPCMRLNADASPTRGSKRCIGIKIIKDHSLRHEKTDKLITNPQIYIGLGKSSYLVPISAAINDDNGPPSPGLSAFGMDQTEMIELPYNGETQMRFMLTDGHIMVGYRDIDIDNETIPVDWNGNIELRGRNSGSCGAIDVVITKTSHRVVSGFRSASSTVSTSPRTSPNSPHFMSTSGRSSKKNHHTPSNYGSGGHRDRRAQSFAFDSDCSNVSLTPTTYMTNARSCHITFIQAEHLMHVKSGKAAFRPYVAVMMGEEKIRTYAVEQCSSERVTIGQTIVLPYTNSRRIKLVVADMSGKDQDPIIGTTNMNVDTYLKASPQRVVLPIAYRGTPSGTLHAIIEFKRTEISTSRVMMTDFASPQDTLVPKSLILQVKSINLHDNKPRQVYINFRTLNTGTNNGDVEYISSSPISLTPKGDGADLKEVVYLPPQTKGPVHMSVFEKISNQDTAEDLHLCDAEAVIDVKNPTSKTVHLIGRSSGDQIGSCVVVVTPSPHQVNGLAIYRFYTAAPLYHSVKVQILRIDNLEVGQQISPDNKLSFSLSRENCTTPGPTVTYEKYLAKFPTCTFTIPIGDIHSKEPATFDVTIDRSGRESSQVFGSAHINIPDSSYAYQHEYQEVSILNNRQELIGIMHCKVALCPKHVLGETGECSFRTDDDLSVYNIIQCAKRPLGSFFRIGLMSLEGIKSAGVADSPEQLSTMVSFVNGNSRYWSTAKHHAGPNVAFPNEYFIAPIQTYRYVRIGVKAFGKHDKDEEVAYYKGKIDLYELSPDHRKEKKIVAELFDDHGHYCGKVNVLACVLHYDGGAKRHVKPKPASTNTVLQQQNSSNDGPPNTLLIEVVKVSDLINPKKSIDTLDPYVIVEFDKTPLKGHTVKNGGCNCEVEDLFYFPYKTGQTARITVYDNAHFSRDDELGSAKLIIDTLLDASHKQQKIKLPLGGGRQDSEPAGFVYLKINFISDLVEKAKCEKKTATSIGIITDKKRSNVSNQPLSGLNSLTRSESSHGESKSKMVHDFKSVKVEIINSIDLKRVERLSERPINPYVVTRLGRNELRSRTVQNGSDSAFFGDCMKFPYGQDRKLKLTVWDNYKMGKDTIIGYAKVDVDQFMSESRSDYYTCHLYNEKMNVSDCGTLSIRIIPSTVSISAPILEHHGTQHVRDFDIVKYENYSSVQFTDLTLKECTVINQGVEKVDIYPLITVLPYSLRGKHSHVESTTTKKSTVRFDDKFNFSTKDIGAKAHFHLLQHKWVTPDPVLGEGSIDMFKLLQSNTNQHNTEQSFSVKLLDQHQQQFAILDGIIKFGNEHLAQGATLTSNVKVKPTTIDAKGSAMDMPEPGQINLHGPHLDAHMPTADIKGPHLNSSAPHMDIHMPSLDIKPPHLNMHAPKLDAHGPKFDAHGPKLDAHGPKFDAHGPKFDAHGPKFDADGPKFDADGPNFDAHGPKFDAHGPKFDAHGPKFDAHGPKFDADGPKFDADGPKFDLNGPKLDGHGPKFDLNGPKFDGHGPRVDLDGPKFDAHGPRLDAHGPKVDLNGPKFEADGPELDAKSPKFDGHSPHFGASGPTIGIPSPTVDGKVHSFEGGDLGGGSLEGRKIDDSRMEMKVTKEVHGVDDALLHKNVNWIEERGSVRPCVHHSGGHVAGEICSYEAKVTVVIQSNGQRVERDVIKAADGSIVLEYRESGLLPVPCVKHSGGHLINEGCPLERQIKLENGQTVCVKTTGKLAAPCMSHSGGHLLSEHCPLDPSWRVRYEKVIMREIFSGPPEPESFARPRSAKDLTSTTTVVEHVQKDTDFTTTTIALEKSGLRNEQSGFVRSVIIEVTEIESVGTYSESIVRPSSIEVVYGDQKLAGHHPYHHENMHQLFEFQYGSTKYLLILLRGSDNRTFGQCIVNVDELVLGSAGLMATGTRQMEAERLKRVACKDIRGSVIGQVAVRIVLSKSEIKETCRVRLVENHIYSQGLDNVHFYEKDFLDLPSKWKSVHFTVHSVHDLYHSDIFGDKMDPYLKVRLHTTEVQSETFRNAGTTVQMNTTFIFPYHNERFLRVLALDEETWRQDQAAGITRLDLTDFANHKDSRLVHHHGIEGTLPVYYKGAERGSVKFNVRFGKHSVPEAHCIKATFNAKTVRE